MGAADELVQKIARPILNFIFEATPVVIDITQTLWNVYKRLPMDYVQLFIGAVMCFFGGFYPTVFAALQAAEHGGLTTVRKALKALSQEATIIINESKKDDKVDNDGDGVSDADQIAGRELVKRKVKLVLTKMDPEKVNDAIASIYKGTSLTFHFCYISVLNTILPSFFSIHKNITFHSVDERIGCPNDPICKDHCFGFDYQRFYQEIC